jgi:hypothetical protein
VNNGFPCTDEKFDGRHRFLIRVIRRRRWDGVLAVLLFLGGWDGIARESGRDGYWGGGRRDD